MNRLTLITALEQPLTFLERHFKRLMPDAEITHYPQPGWQDSDIAVCWKPPHGALASMPNLKLMHSIAAGVDSIMADPGLPDVPLCRIVDPALAAAMAEYVLWATLYFHRGFDRVIANARLGKWHHHDQVAAKDVRVGILGLGAIGIEAAQVLVCAGYRVSGWSRSAKDIAGVQVHSGDAALDPFLADTDILICLLPLTAATTGILNAARLAVLPKGAALVLCSRGEHLVVPDLVAHLRSGHLRGAIIDVFDKEPLAQDNPLWTEPGVLVTPHMAGTATPRVIAEQVAENVRRSRDGAELLNRVNLKHGY